LLVDEVHKLKKLVKNNEIIYDGFPDLIIFSLHLLYIMGVGVGGDTRLAAYRFGYLKFSKLILNHLR
jgi:hypothetical protein